MVLLVQKAHKVLRASLVFLASKASLAKMAPLAPVVFLDRAAAEALKAVMERTVPKE